MEWETVDFKDSRKPKLKIAGNQIRFNSDMRDIILESAYGGVDFLKSENNGKTILACKAGKQFHPVKSNRNYFTIVSKQLADYILLIYGERNSFELILNDDCYILQPI